eukprot:361616-Chlamydomonas_euryale.AAC.7
MGRLVEHETTSALMHLGLTEQSQHEAQIRGFAAQAVSACVPKIYNRRQWWAQFFHPCCRRLKLRTAAMEHTLAARDKQLSILTDFRSMASASGEAAKKPEVEFMQRAAQDSVVQLVRACPCPKPLMVKLVAADGSLAKGEKCSTALSTLFFMACLCSTPPSVACVPVMDPQPRSRAH